MSRQRLASMKMVMPGTVNMRFHIVFCITTPGLRSYSYLIHRLHVRHIGLLHSSAEPNWSSFHRGTIRQSFVPLLYQTFANTKLTDEQKKNIKTEYTNHQERISDSIEKVKDKNLIFIIVESYLSITSDLVVDGKEVTPFLVILMLPTAVPTSKSGLPTISNVSVSSDVTAAGSAGDDDTTSP